MGIRSSLIWAVVVAAVGVGIASPASAVSAAVPPTPTYLLRHAVPYVAATEVLSFAPLAPETPPEHVRRGQAALAQISYPWQNLGFTIEFLPPRDGFRGLTYPGEKRIEIFVSPDMSDAFVLHVLAHEIGHAVDLVYNSRDDETTWLQARGVSTHLAWWPNAYAGDFDSPAGDFAECFAAWTVGSSSRAQLAGSCAGTGQLMAQMASG